MGNEINSDTENNNQGWKAKKRGENKGTNNKKSFTTMPIGEPTPNLSQDGCHLLNITIKDKFSHWLS